MINIYTLICSDNNDGINSIISKKLNDQLKIEFNKKDILFTNKIKYIKDYHLNSCRGCQSCFKNGKCIIIDEQTDFINDLKIADIIIFSVPVYINNIPGTLKIMLDRIAYLVHLMPFIGKRGILITTTSQSGIEMVEGYMEMVFSYLGIALNLKLNFFDAQPYLNTEDKLKIENYINLYTEKKLEIPEILNNVFNHYYNHYIKFLNVEIEDYELNYWRNNYLMYKNLSEIIMEKEKYL